MIKMCVKQTRQVTNFKHMKKVIGIILILISIYTGYVGFEKFSSSGESVKILGLELSAKDSDGRSQAYIILGLSIVSFLGGIYLVAKK